MMMYHLINVTSILNRRTLNYCNNNTTTIWKKNLLQEQLQQYHNRYVMTKTSIRGTLQQREQQEQLQHLHPKVSNYRQNWMLTTTTNTTTTITTTIRRSNSSTSNVSSPNEVAVISRQSVLQYQQHLLQKSKSYQQQQQQQQNNKKGLLARLLNTVMKKKKKDTSSSSTPWPKNIIYGTYLVAAICIPYSIAWFLSSNESLRSKIFCNTTTPTTTTTIVPESSSLPLSYYYCRYISNTILQWMRYQFGNIDYDAISEPEIVSIQVQKLLRNTNNSTSSGNNNNNNTTTTITCLPYKLIDEPTLRIRQQQEYIHYTMNQGTVKFHLVPIIVPSNKQQQYEEQQLEEEMMDTKITLELPANTLAQYNTITSIIKTMLKSSSSSSNIDLEQQHQQFQHILTAPSIAIDFVDENNNIDNNNNNNDDIVVVDDVDQVIPNDNSDNHTNDRYDSGTIPSSLSMMSIYSPWQYQLPVSINNTNTTATTTTITTTKNKNSTTTKKKKNTNTENKEQRNNKKLSNDEIELLRINYEIQVLKTELQNSNTSYRSIDTIQEELQSLYQQKRTILWKLWRLW